MTDYTQIPGSGDAAAFPADPGIPLPQTERKTYNLSPYDGIFAWLSLPAGFLFVRYIVCMADGFLTTAFFLLAYLFCQIYLKCAGCKKSLPHRMLGAVICLFSISFSLTASPLLHGLCFAFLVPAMLWQLTAVRWGKGFVTRYFPLDLRDTVFHSSVQTGAAAAAIGESVRSSRFAGTAKTVLLGVLFTVPLTAIVGSLLAGADAGIEKLMDGMRDLISKNVSDIVLQLGFGIPAGMMLFGMLYAAVKGKNAPDTDGIHAEKLAKLRVIAPLGLYAGVTPVCLLYLIYVISQTSYLISVIAGKVPGGVVYSDYARRGFFELCGIAVINLIVILVLNGMAKHEGRRPKALTFYSTLLCCFTLFIIGTALTKMGLYVHAYGLTRLRLYTAWFMVLLAAGFLVLLVRQFLRRFPTAAVLTGTFLVMFAGLCFVRPDALIAEYNLTRFEQGTLADADIPMLCRLSEDAYIVLAKHPEAIEKAGMDDFWQKKLTNKIGFLDSHPTQSWNLSAVLLEIYAEQQA